MTTQNESQGGQSGTTDDGTNAGATPQGSMDMMDYSADDLLAAITRDKSTVTPTPEAQQSPTAQGAQPDADDDTDHNQTGEQQQGKQQAIRLRLSSLTPEQQAETAEAYALVRDGKATDLVEAFSQLRGTNTTPNADASNADQSQQSNSTANDPVSELETQLSELRAERRKARELFEDDRESELTEQIENLTRRIAKEELKAEFALQQREQHTNDFEAQYQSAVTELEHNFPDVLDDNSQFTELLSSKMDAARYRNDPGLADPRFILQMADQVSALLNKPSGRTPTAPPNAPRATGGNVAPAHNPVPRPSEDQMRMAIENASPEELLQVLSKKR